MYVCMYVCMYTHEHINAHKQVQQHNRLIPMWVRARSHRQQRHRHKLQHTNTSIPHHVSLTTAMQH